MTSNPDVDPRTLDEPTISEADHQPGEAHPRRWQILGIMCSCLVLVVAGVSSLNIAIPPIISDLQPSSTELLWIVDSYALVFAGLLLPAGALGDRYGRKGALLIGLGIVTAGALWSSQADTAVQLIAARASMGVGAAFVMPATLSIIVSVFPPHERGKAIAMWAGFAGAGGAIGTIGAGVLLQWFSWASVFFINVPLALAAMAMIALRVPSSRDGEATPLDPIGSVLSIAGLVTLVYAIIEGGDAGWTEPTTLGAFAAAVVLLAAWLVWESRTTNPMLDPSLFRLPRFALGSLTIASGFAVMFGMFFLIIQYFQFVLGVSPLEAGLRNLPFPITMILVSPRAPVLVTKLGTRKAVALGLLIQAAGFGLLSQLDRETPYLLAAAGMVLLASGMAIIMPPSSEAIVSSLPPNKAGVGSAWNDTTREVGGALGIAVMGTLLASTYRSSLGPVLDTLPEEAREVANEGVGGALRVAEGASLPDLVPAAQAAFLDGMQVAFLAAVALTLVTAVVIGIRYPADEQRHSPH